MSDEQPAPKWPVYRFKWRNIDIEGFVQQRRYAADSLRRDAEILLKRAEQIEAEMHEWARALEAAP